MLDNVTVGWEIWRTLNGFPLSISPSDALPGTEVAGDKSSGKGGGKK